MNSITVYLVAEIIGGFSSVAVRLAGGDVKGYLDAHVAKGFGGDGHFAGGSGARIMVRPLSVSAEGLHPAMIHSHVCS